MNEVELLKSHIRGLLQIIHLMENNTLPKDYATFMNLKHWVDKAREAAQ